MSASYTIVNPYISGKMNKTFKGKNPLIAANNAYKAMSKYFSNNIPKFYFTLQKVRGKTAVGGGKSNDYFHFQVKEMKNGKKVEYDITSYDSAGDLSQFRENVSRVAKKQEGGRKYNDDDDDDDDFDDSSEYKYKRTFTRTQPISFWWYDPYVYRLHKYYVPTFIVETAPYIEIPIYL